jgi:cytochrome c oxidase subunit I
VPKQAGGELVSDPLARLAFLMFLLFSVPVGFHHQFTDPGIPAGWKMVHSMLTMFVGVPSLLTAFTVAASLEVAGRRNGGRGVIGWIGQAAWRDPSVTAQLLAMIAFIFGGAGGIVNASFNLNMLVHNTAWIPGHFHLTVGTAVTLTFFGITFWLLPHLLRKPLYSPAMALWASWTWFVGMMVFALGMHWQGILAVPRRAYISNLPAALAEAYANAARADGDHRRLGRHPHGGRHPLLHGRVRHGLRAQAPGRRRRARRSPGRAPAPTRARA